MVPGGGGDGPGVHQDHPGQLPVAGLGPLPVGEVPGGVADGQAVVGGHVPGAEAGAAEAGLEEGPGLQQGLLHPVVDELQVHRHRGGIDGQGEVPAAHVVAVQDGGGFGDVVVHAAGAAGDDALVHHDLPVHQLVGEGEGDLAAELLGGALLHLPEDVPGVGHELPNGVGLGGVEGEGGHGLHLRQVDGDQAVIVRPLLGMEGLIGLRPAVDGQVLLHRPVGLPDGGEAGGLGGHHVDADAVVHGQVLDAGAHEFQDLILHKAVLVDLTAQGDGHVVGAHALGGLPGEVDHHHFRGGDVIGVFQQLLDDLRAAFAHAHGADGAVAGVAVRPQDHPAAAGHHLSGVLVDDRLVGGDKVAPVLDGGGQAEDVVVLVDGAAHSAQAVVAVGHHIGDGELGQAAGLGGLDDAHIGDVVGDEAVKLQVKLAGLLLLVVAAEDLVGHGLLPVGGRGHGDGGPILPADAGGL